jgi:serine/threonine protein kinase
MKRALEVHGSLLSPTAFLSPQCRFRPPFPLRRYPSDFHPRCLTDFTIIRELGHGRYGSVFLAEDPSGAAVAIRQTPKRYERIREVQLRVFEFSRWVPRLHHCFENETDFYCVTDYLSGGTLQSVIDQEERLSDRMIKRLIAQIVAAVADVHRLGVVHRDLKPENVVFDSKGRVRLIDFEFASFVGECSSEGPVRGTWGFLAPEVLEGNNVGFANDWWAVGVMAYAAKFGRLPFYSENLVRLRELVMKAETWIPNKSDPSFASLVRGMLAKEPQARIGEDAMNHEYFDGIEWGELEMEEEHSETVVWNDREL